MGREHSLQHNLCAADCGHRHRRSYQRGRITTTGERDAGQDDDEQEERERARRKGAERPGRKGSAPAHLQRPERDERQRAAQHERVGARQDEHCPDERERPDRPGAVLTPFPPDDGGEGDDRACHRQHREKLDPDQGRERVVQDAVGDEAVPPGVPEVVPQDEAVVEVQSPLVHVCGEVGARRAEPDEHTGEKAGSRRRKDQLAACVVEHKQMLPEPPGA